jgi:hypothetical protein
MSTLPESAAPKRLFGAFRNRSKSPAGDAVITPITQRDSTKSTTHYLAHRLHVVFDDIGLSPHVPSDWLQPGPDGLAFRSLTLPEADKLVLAVEDLAQGYESPTSSVGSDQLTFDLSDE